VNGVEFPLGMTLEVLRRDHPRKQFSSGQPPVDAWLRTKALQQQEKHLSATKVLLDSSEQIAGYYTLAISQIEFADLPTEMTRHLPKRLLPVAVLAWLGVSQFQQGGGLGKRLLAQALLDSYVASQTLPFIGVVLDCIDGAAKAFFQSCDFAELPGRANRLVLSMKRLEAMLKS